MDTAQGSSTWWKRATKYPENLQNSESVRHQQTHTGSKRWSQPQKWEGKRMAWISSLLRKSDPVKKELLELLKLRASDTQPSMGLWSDGDSPGKGGFTWTRRIHLTGHGQLTFLSPLHSHRATAWTTCRWNLKWVVNPCAQSGKSQADLLFR